MVTYEHDAAFGNDVFFGHGKQISHPCGATSFGDYAAKHHLAAGETSFQLAVNSPQPWWLLGESVRGANHIRQGLPNQDSILSYPHGGAEETGIFELGNRVALAVADGHGSAKCFRSQIGSDCAVKVAISVAKEFLAAQEEIRDLTLVKRVAEERLARELALKWTRVIHEHHLNQPFTEEELDSLERSSGKESRKRIEADPRLAYGTTLLLAMVTQEFAIYLQLGDGDILTVSGAGEVSRPIARDERLFANETTSLSAKDAWRDFRFAFQIFSGEMPALIVLATDGYANSFASEDGFLQVGRDILTLIRTTSIKQVKDEMSAWLNDATVHGSGDDITLGLSYREQEIGVTAAAVEEKSQEDTDAASKERTATDH